MKRLILLAGVSVLSLAQQAVPPDEVTVQAYSMDNDGSVIHLSGHVVIKSLAVTIRTEKAKFNKDTHAVRTYGEATVELK